MSNKEFFFLSGLQRSGATLLSSILNQNPEIYVSPSSPLLPMLIDSLNFYSLPQNIDYDVSSDIDNVCSGVAESLYSSKDNRYVIDKNHWWPYPGNINLIKKYITKDIKIICPVRNILEILVSFNTIIEKNPNSKDNLLDRYVLEQTYDNKPMADRRADWLMRPKGDIDTHLYGMGLSKNPKLRSMFYFIEYNDLVNNTEQAVNDIYKFLNIKPFKHTFNNLKGNMPSKSITGIYDLHEVRPTIEKKSVRPEDVFLPETIYKYSNLEFWRSL